MGYINGYAIQTKPIVGIGATPLNVPPPEDDELFRVLDLGPKPMCRDSSDKKESFTSEFIPAYVAFDKVVRDFFDFLTIYSVLNIFVGFAI